MLFRLFLAVALFAGQGVFADGLNTAPQPSIEKVRLVKARMGKWLFTVPGVNGLGITACDTKSGKPFTAFPQSQLPSMVFENCLGVLTETREAADMLLERFPVGSRYHRVYVVIEFVGPIHAL